LTWLEPDVPEQEEGTGTDDHDAEHNQDQHTPLLIGFFYSLVISIFIH
jgi:hypothetical protein